MNFQKRTLLFFLTIRTMSMCKDLRETNILKFLANAGKNHLKQSILDVLFESKEEFCDIMMENNYHTNRPNLESSTSACDLDHGSYLDYCRKKILSMDKGEFINFYLKQNYYPTVNELVNIMYILTPLNVEGSSLTSDMADEIWNGVLNKYAKRPLQYLPRRVYQAIVRNLILIDRDENVVDQSDQRTDMDGHVICQSLENWMEAIDNLINLCEKVQAFGDEYIKLKFTVVNIDEKERFALETVFLRLKGLRCLSTE